MDLYELLGIARGATLVEIKRSYKRLARKYHPDINPGDNAAEARFKEITRADETLSDPERRLRYDAGALSASASVSFEFEGFDFSVGVGQTDAPTFGDLFAGGMRFFNLLRLGLDFLNLSALTALRSDIAYVRLFLGIQSIIFRESFISKKRFFMRLVR